jgi:hypothetical protein
MTRGSGARRVGTIFLVGWIFSATSVEAQTMPFVGGAAGFATLSADGHATVTSAAAAVSVYAPDNGPAVNLFAGLHLADYVSLQGNYVANTNRVTLTSSAASDRGVAFYQQERTSVQHAVIADLLVYFRERGRLVRPYLSVGAGLVRLASDVVELKSALGDLAVPAPRFASTAAGLRVAVGMDVAIRNGWVVRYTFSETIRGNPISGQLSPAGQRDLANFQNLFGVVKSLSMRKDVRP